MSTVPTRPAVRGTRHGRGRRRCWPLAITGLALLAISIVMMMVGAQSSRAQTSRQHPAHSRLAPPRLALARHHDARLVTLDRGVVAMAGHEASDVVLVPVSGR